MYGRTARRLELSSVCREKKQTGKFAPEGVCRLVALGCTVCGLIRDRGAGETATVGGVLCSSRGAEGFIPSPSASWRHAFFEGVLSALRS